MGIKIDRAKRKRKPKTLIVTFCSLSGTYHDPPIFEFSNLLSKIASKCDRYFYMDETRSWYQYGVPYISSNIDEFIENLRGAIAEYKNVIFMGISSGGYAAILFGSILNVNTVISFVPQTILTNELCGSCWGTQFTENHPYKDLMNVINTETKYVCICAENIEGVEDIHGNGHCLRLEKYANVEITKIYWEGGILTRYKDSGFLKQIISPHIL